MEEQNKQRPDPLFKEMVNKEARRYGLGSELTELRVQQATTSDLLLTIPPGFDLRGTIFYFFRLLNVLEFKSVVDRLTKSKFAVQLGRVALWAAQNHKGDFEDILNIIVTAHYPEEVLKYCEERDCRFVATDGQEWLLQARCGLQDVAIVICEKLPLDLRYESWLMFAPPTSDTWRNFLLLEAQAGNRYILDKAYELNPKEFTAMKSKILEYFEQYGPEEQARIRDEWHQVADDIVSQLTPEERLRGLKPEERLRGLKPEERLRGLKPEERLRDLKPEERLRGLKPEERIKDLTPEELETLRKLLSDQAKKDE